MQLEQAKMQLQHQLKVEEAKLQAQLDQHKAEKQAGIEATQAQADIAVQRQKADVDIELSKRRFELDAQLKILEARLKYAQMKVEARKDGGKPIPGDMDIDDIELLNEDAEVNKETLETLMALRESAQTMGQIPAAIQALAEAVGQMNRPKQVIRDNKGRVAGVQ